MLLTSSVYLQEIYKEVRTCMIILCLYGDLFILFCKDVIQLGLFCMISIMAV